MKTLKFFTISLLATAIIFIFIAVLAETFNIGQWPANYQIGLLLGVAAVDMLLVKQYSK